MGDLYHINAARHLLGAYLRLESWNSHQFSLHCHLTAVFLPSMISAGDILFDLKLLMQKEGA